MARAVDPGDRRSYPVSRQARERIDRQHRGVAYTSCKVTAGNDLYCRSKTVLPSATGMQVNQLRSAFPVDMHPQMRPSWRRHTSLRK